MDFSTIVDHPDYTEIVSKIVSGVGPKDISQWLKIKYPNKDQKHLQLSIKSIQEFTDKHLDLEDQLRKDIATISNDGLSEKKISASLLNNKTYQERLVEIATTEVDLKRLITELVMTCKARMEQVFDKLQENPSGVGKGDYVLLKYFEVLFVAMEKFDKIVNNAPDQIIQHNVTIQAVEQQTAILQEAIRETLAHIDSEAAILFIEILTQKLNALQMPESEMLTQQDRTKEVKLLQEMVIPIVEQNE